MQSVLPSDLFVCHLMVSPLSQYVMKLFYARGAIVQLLVSSNTARYVEFKAVTASYLVEDTGLYEVRSIRPRL